VHNKQLNAISQYYFTCFFPELVAEAPSLIHRILDYYNAHIKALIPLQSYIIDFAILKDKIIVIELNPFNIATGIN